MKLDFDDPSQTKLYELADGEFATEPIFVPKANGLDSEDNGYILVQTIDGKSKKAAIVILNAIDMKLLYRALAPGLGLFGLHSKFFDYSQGCSIDDCTPGVTTTTVTTTPATSSIPTTNPETTTTPTTMPTTTPTTTPTSTPTQTSTTSVAHKSFPFNNVLIMISFILILM